MWFRSNQIGGAKFLYLISHMVFHHLCGLYLLHKNKVYISNAYYRVIVGGYMSELSIRWYDGRDTLLNARIFLRYK